MTRRAILAAAVCLLLAGPASAQQLTTLDYFEIENLIARYGHGFDSGADQGYMWADVFTPDGVFMDGSGREFRGRDVIAQFGSGGANSRKSPTSVGHFISNILIEPVAGGATARSYVMIGGGGGRGRGAAPAAGAPPAPAFGMGGTYYDRLVKTPVGWRIQERVLVRPGATVDAIRAATARTTPPSSLVPAPPDASGSLPGALGLTADDHARILQLQLTDQQVVSNVMITPVANGAVVKAYRMRVEKTDAGTAIGPEGIYFTFFAKAGNAWQPRDGHYMPLGSPVPEAAQQYAPIRAIVTLPQAPAMAAGPQAFVSADDYAAIRQLYARTAADEDKGEPHHYIYNVRVEAVPGGARGSARYLVVNLGGQGRPTTVSESGEYRDELVKAGGAWSFRARSSVPR